MFQCINKLGGSSRMTQDNSGEQIKEHRQISTNKPGSTAQSCLTPCNPMDYSTPGRILCPSPALGAYSNSHPSSQ